MIKIGRYRLCFSRYLWFQIVSKFITALLLPSISAVVLIVWFGLVVVTRAAFGENWFNRSWQPPSNQLMGLALCAKAAAIFQENFRQEPWN